MPNTLLASRILIAITSYPDHHDQRHFINGADRLSADEGLSCGTTLCVAGFAAHLTGHTILNEVEGVVAIPVSDGTSVSGVADALPVSAVARRELGLDARDTELLFSPSRTSQEARAALLQLVEGVDSIDWRAILPE
ncbi:hypothetical protein [Streptomyces sp. NPDC013457]|uniref:hypothetical protein n=1 Tax=Streptomyces sp. NPDC013457 TaxID=3364866 RepID=UPI0036FFD298